MAQWGGVGGKISDPTDGFYNGGWRIQFIHVPSGTKVAFKAFLTDFSDNFTSNWNEEPVFGRMDPIMTFQNTTRSISLGWSIVAKSPAEAMQNLQDASLLLSMQYPAYESRSASSIVAPPLFRVRLSNLIQEGGESMVCAIGGFSFNPDLDQGFFQQGASGAPRTRLSPKVINMSCELKVLHTHDLGWDTKGKWRGHSRGSFAYGSVSINDIAARSGAGLGDRRSESPSGELGNNPDETEARDCALLSGDAKRECIFAQQDAQEGMAEEAIAKHDEHLRKLEEEGGPVTRERAMEQRREQRAEFKARREQLRASAEPGSPPRSNAQLNRAIAEERGMTPEQMEYAIGHGPFRPA